MKEELLDIDAYLSQVQAHLTMPTPDIAKALTALDEARTKVLDLAEGLENTQKN